MYSPNHAFPYPCSQRDIRVVGVLSKPNHAFPYPCSQGDILSTSYMSGRCTLQTKPRHSIPLHPCSQWISSLLPSSPLRDKLFNFCRLFNFSPLFTFFSPLLAEESLFRIQSTYTWNVHIPISMQQTDTAAPCSRALFFWSPSRCFSFTLKSATLSASLLLP